MNQWYGYMSLLKHFQAGDEARGSARFNEPFQLGGLPGTWLNTDKDSCGIVKVTIAVKDRKLFVRAFGGDVRAAADWGEVEADHIYGGSISSRVASGFTAWYDFDVSRIQLQANWNQGLLVLAAFTFFKDGSKHSNYFSREFLYRELTQQQGD